MIRRFLCGLAVLPFLASIASAGQSLSDQQMDRVIAGFAVPVTCSCAEEFIGMISVSPSPPPCCVAAYEAIFAGIEATLPKTVFTFNSPF
jgi:hypothetical protein